MLTQELKQDLFTKMFRGLESQGFQQSLLEAPIVRCGLESKCAYRGLEGRKCAVGQLIPDHNYTPHMEGKGLINNVWGAIFSEWYNYDVDVWLCKVQKIHDGNDVPDEMKAKLLEFAAQEGITL